MITRILAAGALAGAMIAGATAASAEELEAKAGYLRCDVASGVSFIFGSTRDVSCKYEPVGDGPVQHYEGSIDRYGIDIGYMDSAVMLWAVATGGEDAVGAGDLTGNYIGVSAEVAAGYGVGVNALVLSEKSLALQPISIEGGKGLNLAAGVAELELNYQP